MIINQFKQASIQNNAGQTSPAKSAAEGNSTQGPFKTDNAIAYGINAADQLSLNDVQGNPFKDVTLFSNFGEDKSKINEALLGFGARSLQNINPNFDLNKGITESDFGGRVSPDLFKAIAGQDNDKTTLSVAEAAAFARAQDMQDGKADGKITGSTLKQTLKNYEKDSITPASAEKTEFQKSFLSNLQASYKELNQNQPKELNLAPYGTFNAFGGPNGTYGLGSVDSKVLNGSIVTADGQKAVILNTDGTTQEAGKNNFYTVDEAKAKQNERLGIAESTKSTQPGQPANTQNSTEGSQPGQPVTEAPKKKKGFLGILGDIAKIALPAVIGGTAGTLLANLFSGKKSENAVYINS